MNLDIHQSWKPYLKSEFEKPYFKELIAFIQTEYRTTQCFPKQADIFNAFNLCIDFILLNNIYGVDIDRQAVEVSKLSLLLQVLEGETDESLGQQLSLWQERALPDLGNNIKCGNSLIGPEYFQSQLIPDDNEMRRVNPFDWDIEFH